jgi:anti-sigma factor RsiW
MAEHDDIHAFPARLIRAELTSGRLYEGSGNLEGHPGSEQIEAYVHGRLAETDRIAVLRHLAVCPLCFTTATELERLTTYEWHDEVELEPNEGSPSGLVEGAQAAWKALVTGFDPQAWTIVPAHLAYAGGAFASAEVVEEERVYQAGETVRWTLAIEGSHHILYVEATKPATIFALIYDQQGANPPIRRPIQLERLDVRETSFVWRKREDLGRLDELVKQFGAYDVAVVIGA